MKFVMRDPKDALITYILPDNFTVGAFDEYALYNIYIKSNEHPTATSFNYHYKMNIRDLESSETGFKVFIPANTLQKGVAYIGLKPQDSKSLGY